MPATALARRTSIVLLLVVTTAACATVPYTGRRQLAIFSPEKERALGAAAYTEMLRRGRVADAPALQAVIEDVGRRLAAVAERPNWEWEFTLFDDPREINAWALPGGKVGVYTGILPIAEDEAGLATILGHEVAHVIAHHGAERTGQGTILNLLGVGVGIAATVAGMDGRGAMQLFGLGADVGVLLPFSRSQEAEADEIGLILMARAGYDPRAATALWERMAHAVGGSEGVAFLATHPSGGSRVAHINAVLPRALTYYRGDGDAGRRPLPGVPPQEESDLALVMARLDRLALDPAGAERVAFAIASEMAMTPDAVVTFLAEHDLTPGEAALAFVLSQATNRPIEAIIAAASTDWSAAVRTSGIDEATIVTRLTRIANAAEEDSRAG